mmetsp:Transcript_46284/g.148629  ORF Transcript_46284/g.148629 Transcript_46284/m.148629 type:complete len:109 (+) Transcript_46284:87-413(+)
MPVNVQNTERCLDHTQGSKELADYPTSKDAFETCQNQQVQQMQKEQHDNRTKEAGKSLKAPTARNRTSAAGRTTRQKNQLTSTEATPTIAAKSKPRRARRITASRSPF